MRQQAALELPETPDDGAAAFSTVLLGWYDRHARTLPWRARPGETADPYAVWLSEVMLQQTTVAAVIPYYQRFLQRWPRVDLLAAADFSDVAQEWAGLGYYSRARNLHRCARLVVAEHGGRFPGTENELRALPGIGAYTAAAVASIAFGQRAVVVDGNVERVAARLEAVEAPLPACRPALRVIADRLTPDQRPGDYAQAMMDLGATICTPKSPGCIICPVRCFCAATRRGDPASFPRRLPKRAKPGRFGSVFVITDSHGCILVRPRPAEGLFGGMTELPGSAWVVGEPSGDPPDLPAFAGAPLTEIGVVEHGLTHFDLRLSVYKALWNGALPESHRWIDPKNANREGLPTLMMKVVKLWLDSLP